MLYAFWRFIQLLLPYWLVIFIHKRNKALPTNLKTREGNNYKAIMITNNCGIIFSEDEYIKNRAKFLKKQKALLDEYNKQIINEINSLPFEEREKLFGYLSDGSI